MLVRNNEPIAVPSFLLRDTERLVLVRDDAPDGQQLRHTDNMRIMVHAYRMNSDLPCQENLGIDQRNIVAYFLWLNFVKIMVKGTQKRSQRPIIGFCQTLNLKDYGKVYTSTPASKSE